MCVFSSPFHLIFGRQATAPPQAADVPALKAEAVAEVDKMQTLTQQMVDEIYSFSELGFQEYETSRYVTGILEKNGFRSSAASREFPRRGWPPGAPASR